MIETAMLSRVAGNLFWLGRYIERAENVARLADAARRIEALPSETGVKSSEWASALIAAGTRGEGAELFEISRADAVNALFFGRENPSSVVNALEGARENAREVRADLTQEVWEGLNNGWREYRPIGERPALINLPDLIDFVKTLSAQIRGAINGSLLRNDGFYFIRMGQCIERIDATARLIDVKYNVLLPDVDDVGRNTDRTQWQALLQAAAAQRAYTYATKSDLSAKGVARFLIFSEMFPRSILYSAHELRGMLTVLERYYDEPASCHAQVLEFVEWIEGQGVDQVMAQGLHEFLTQVIASNYAVADAVAASYGFGATTDIDDVESNAAQ